MNHDAVNWAKVWRGPVYYFSRSQEKHIDIENPIFVEVGKWTSAGAERISEDFFCSYYAALLLGYDSPVHGMAWLPASHDRSGDRKYLIGKGWSKDGIYQSLSMVEARIIASKINLVMALAKIMSLKMLYFDKHLKPLILEILSKIKVWILEKKQLLLNKLRS